MVTAIKLALIRKIFFEFMTIVWQDRVKDEFQVAGERFRLRAEGSPSPLDFYPKDWSSSSKHADPPWTSIRRIGVQAASMQIPLGLLSEGLEFKQQACRSPLDFYPKDWSSSSKHADHPWTSIRRIGVQAASMQITL